MADYISREKAIECIQPHVKPTTVYGEGYMQAIEHAVGILSLIPAADVQPVKYGYWEEEEPRVLKCSVCGEYAPMNYLGQNCIDSRYCPWCGARMIKDGDTE